MGWGRAVAKAGCPRCRAWDAWPGRDWTGECNYSADVWEQSPSGFFPGRRWNTASVKENKDEGTHNTRGTPEWTLPSGLAVPSTWIQREQVRPLKAFLWPRLFRLWLHPTLMNDNSTSLMAQEEHTDDGFNEACSRFHKGTVGTNEAAAHTNTIIISGATRATVIIGSAKQSSMISFWLYQGEHNTILMTFISLQLQPGWLGMDSR